MIACKGATAPTPERSAWTAEGLRKAAKEVWDEWFSEHMPAKLPDGVTREAQMQALVDAELTRKDAPAEARPPKTQR